ncbi:hypothetical protein AAFN88_09155 [Pelagibius sp. CAU 1746]|uniref:hypothetical protein n=1 Tax=Pelagibius sp. CAU 1746 TaxID=3140370 RepID=UPI00325AE44F
MTKGVTLARCFAGVLLVAVITTGQASPVRACMFDEPYEADKPFYENYFNGAEVIFRGQPVDYRYPEWNSSDPTIVSHRVEITFRVTTTYQGEERKTWTAVWVTTAFLKPIDLLAFKQEIGDDLVVVLDEWSDVVSDKFGDLPYVAHQNCGQPGMRSYAVMEPVLRERGLID